MKFVKAMETNYTDTIRGIKEKAEILTRKLRALRSERINEQTEKTDLEKLFVSCIEEARREVMRRRFRTEVANRKTSSGGNEDEARDFEESLYKLGQLQRKKVRADDFSAKDRFIMLDLFVNNEKTLLKIYEALFQSGTNAIGAAQPLNQTSKGSLSINQLASSQAVSPREPLQTTRLPSIRQLGP